MKALIDGAMRRAVVKSGLRRVRRSERCEPSWKPISRSIRPPEAMRPVVGTPEMTVVGVALRP